MSFDLAWERHTMELPGSFVVLQGMEGDGLINTMDTSPDLDYLEDRYDEYDDDDDNEGGGGEGMIMEETNDNSNVIIETDYVPYPPPQNHAHPTNETSVTMTRTRRTTIASSSPSQNQQLQLQQPTHPRPSRTLLRKAIAEWHETSCVQKATLEAVEWLQMAKHHFSLLCNSHHRQHNNKTTTTTTATTSQQQQQQQQTIPILSTISHRYWLHQAQLRVFPTLPHPCHYDTKQQTTTTNGSHHDNNKNDNDLLQIPSTRDYSHQHANATVTTPLALYPGSVLHGIALHTFEFTSIVEEDDEERKSTNNHHHRHQHPGSWKYIGSCTQCRGSSRDGEEGNNHENSNDSETDRPLPLEHYSKAGRLQFLEISAILPSSTSKSSSSLSPPQSRRRDDDDDDNNVGGYVLFSVDGYTVLAPGLPTGSLFTGLTDALLVEPQLLYLSSSSSSSSSLVWWWKVTCAAGAVVRQSVELKSKAMATLPYGTYVQVFRKVINQAGLSRLFIKAAITRSSTTTSSTAEQQDQKEEHHSTIIIEGWCSEFLNPLSGERGPIVRPVPLALPILYRVILPPTPTTATVAATPVLTPSSSSCSSSGSIAAAVSSTPTSPTTTTMTTTTTLCMGALVRERVDLASPVLYQLSYGTEVAILQRLFTEFPATDCIPRLKLGPNAYASVRLNNGNRNFIFLPTRQVDPRFDPTQPGWYHVTTQQAQQQLQLQPLHATEQPLRGNDHRNNDDAPPQFQHHHQRYQHTSDELAEDTIMAARPRSLSSSSLSSAGSRSAAGNTAAVTVSPNSSGDVDGGVVDDEQPRPPNQTLLHPPKQTFAFPQYPPPGGGGAGGGPKSSSPKNQQRRRPPPFNPMCVCCLTQEADATLIHGETGHICCCLECARVCKSQALGCPLCRKAIDQVIQHFYS